MRDLPGRVILHAWFQQAHGDGNVAAESCTWYLVYVTSVLDLLCREASGYKEENSCAIYTRLKRRTSLQAGKVE
jgi:hypothetical protein